MCVLIKSARAVKVARQSEFLAKTATDTANFRAFQSSLGLVDGWMVRLYSIDIVQHCMHRYIIKRRLIGVQLPENTRRTLTF
jgi:hypothetical protein